MSHRSMTDKWIKEISKSPKEAEEEYDRICGCYDRDIEAKGYRAPEDAAIILTRFVSPNGVPTLDVGCGTGLVGLKMREQGFTNITGMDISANSLKEAVKKGVYVRVVKHNILDSFPFEDASFGAVVCVGVCSRFDDVKILGLIAEFARVVGDPGIMLISHRDDLMKSSRIIPEIKSNGIPGVGFETVTKPYPYIPGDAHYKNLDVRYIVLRKISPEAVSGKYANH